MVSQVHVRVMFFVHVLPLLPSLTMLTFIATTHILHLPFLPPYRSSFGYSPGSHHFSAKSSSSKRALNENNWSEQALDVVKVGEGEKAMKKVFLWFSLTAGSPAIPQRRQRRMSVVAWDKQRRKKKNVCGKKKFNLNWILYRAGIEQQRADDGVKSSNNPNIITILLRFFLLCNIHNELSMSYRFGITWSFFAREKERTNNDDSGCAALSSCSDGN